MSETERWKWPVPNENEIEALLVEGGQECLQERINRLQFIIEEFGPERDMLLTGGFNSALALWDLKGTFINGHFLSTILCAHVFAESVLGNELILFSEERTAENGLGAIIHKSKKRGLISEELFDRLDELRRIRIAYFHIHGGLKDRSLMKRIIDHKLNPDDLAEKDAKKSIEIVVDLLRFRDPQWRP